MTTALETYQKVYDNWGERKPPLTSEEFAKLPEKKQVGTLEAIAHLNPGFWAEKVVGKPFQIDQVSGESPRTIVFASIPTVEVETTEGTKHI